MTDAPAGSELLVPSRLWSRTEVLARPSPVPASPGIYAWFFRNLPHAAINARRCVWHNGLALLYVGIAPSPPPRNGKSPSRQNLRTRIRYHYRGNAYGSTLRLSLGCLLSDQLGIRLQRVGSGTRLTFAEGEQALSDWMSEHAFVTWVENDEPWHLEDELIASLDLPLNLRGNATNAFFEPLTAIRSASKAAARLR